MNLEVDAEENNKQLYFAYIISIKELMLLYVEQGIFELAGKFADLLEEENLEFFEFSEKLEYLIGKSQLGIQDNFIREHKNELLKVK